MRSNLRIWLLASVVALTPALALAGAGDPGTGDYGSDSPSSQPVAREQAGPQGHCTQDSSGRASCAAPASR
jgi:hypothetical protein